jgi:hypothetical protein
VKKKSGMETVPCKIFMNETKIETNLIKEEIFSLQIQESEFS